MKTNILISTVCAAVMLLTAPVAMAQNDHNGMRRGEVTGALTVGYAATPYEGSGIDWKNKNGFGVGLGFDYTYWFTQHFGLSAGLRLNYVSSDQEATDVETEASGYMTTKLGTKTNVKADVSTSSIKETQVLGLFEIPLKVSLQAKHLYGNVGVSLAVPFSSYASYTYAVSPVVLTFSSDAGGVITPSLLDADELDQSNNSSNYKTSDAANVLFFNLVGEIGWKFYFDDRNMMSVGIYGRYAFNKVSADKDDYAPFSIRGDKYNEARTSVRPMLSTSLVDKFGYFEGGFRVAYHFGTGKTFQK